VYATKPQNLDELHARIIHETEAIPYIRNVPKCYPSFLHQANSLSNYRRKTFWTFVVSLTHLALTGRVSDWSCLHWPDLRLILPSLAGSQIDFTFTGRVSDWSCLHWPGLRLILPSLAGSQIDLAFTDRVSDWSCLNWHFFLMYVIYYFSNTWRSKSRSYPDVQFSALSICGVKSRGSYLKFWS